MISCPYSAYCIESVCDNACPTYAEVSHLLEINGIDDRSKVYRAPKEKLCNAQNILREYKDGTFVAVPKDTLDGRERLAYVAICEKWRGNRLHASVYSLNLGPYIDSIQKSWSDSSVLDRLSQMNIWIQTSEILIIYGLDYLRFKDFQSQTFLNMIQQRNYAHLTTYVISPPISSLSGDGDFFKDRLVPLLKKAVIE